MTFVYLALKMAEMLYSHIKAHVSEFLYLPVLNGYEFSHCHSLMTSRYMFWLQCRITTMEVENGMD
jgi:hypothetical protein